MRLVRCPELKFDFVTSLGFGILKKEVEPPRPRLAAFAVPKHQFTESKDTRILLDSVLNPALPLLRVGLQVNLLGLLIIHGHGSDRKRLVTRRDGTWLAPRPEPDSECLPKTGRALV